ncbi:hypothetical protein [Nonomuraea sp. NPDC046570]|uniref:YncE family protein n=1 Tax=Nonomuraea sp. NPDC046570 TaxID=3155255 RepID=UPI0033F8ED6A
MRYAGLATCASKSVKRHICGPWRLWLRGGMILPLPDAQVRAIDSGGREMALRAPIAVDPTGRHVAYIARSTHQLVVHSLTSGKINHLARTAFGGVPMEQLDLLLSPAGRYLVIDPELGTQETSVFEVATGKRWTLPDYAKVMGFSADGRLLLVKLDGEESAVYSPGGRQPSGGTTVTGWVALGDGGTTLAGVAREGGRVVVRFYATSNAMESRKPLRLKIPPKQEPRRLDWASRDRLTLLTLRQPGSYVTRSVDTHTGRMHISDSYTTEQNVWDIHLAGE